MFAEKNITNRQLDIIEAAGKVIIDKGLTALTTKNLAAELQVSEGALYKHFKSKVEIISNMLEFLCKNIDERLSNICATEAKSDEKLIHIFNSQFEYFAQNPHFVIAILSEGLWDDNEQINEKILQLMHTKRKFLSSTLEEGKANNIFTNTIETNQLVMIIMGSFRLQILLWKFSNFQFDLLQQGNVLMQNAIQLIKTNPEK